MRSCSYRLKHSADVKGDESLQYTPERRSPLHMTRLYIYYITINKAELFSTNISIINFIVISFMAEKHRGSFQQCLIPAVNLLSYLKRLQEGIEIDEDDLGNVIFTRVDKEKHIGDA